MAQFNSVIIGKGTGKIGSVCLKRGYPLTVATSSRRKSANASTLAQNASRNQFYNCVRVYKVCKSLVKKTQPAREGKGNYYNTFISNFKAGFSVFPEQDYNLLIRQCSNLWADNSQWSGWLGRVIITAPMIKNVVISATKLRIYLYSFKPNLYLSFKLWVFAFGNNSNSGKLIPYIVTAQQLTNEMIEVDFVGTANQLALCAFVSDNNIYCSNLCFSNYLNM